MVAQNNSPYRQVVAQRAADARPTSLRQTAAAQAPAQTQNAHSANRAANDRPELRGQPGATRVINAARSRVAAMHAKQADLDAGGAYNPGAYGGSEWQNGLQRAVPDARNRIFNTAGQINANSKKDALQQIAFLMQSALGGGAGGSSHRQAAQDDGMSSDERRQVLAAAVRDPEGFSVLGQELLSPIKDIVDYEGWTRKVYRVRTLTDGENYRIPKDVRSTAWVVGQDGQGIESRLFARWIQPPTFKITSYPTVDIQDLAEVNYDLMDRAQDTARQEIELEEDKRGVALLDVAAQTKNTVTTFGTLGVGAFEDVRYQVERHRLVVEKFLINRAELSDIVKTMSAQVDPVTERELILAGYIGTFLNAMIVTAAGTGVEEVIPAGTFYAVTGPEYLGEMVIRMELFSEPFNMFAMQRMVKGWAFGEVVGFAISNPHAVAKGVK